MNKGFNKGKTYVMYVPTGWIIAGTVTEMDNENIYLSDAVYVQEIGTGSAMGSIAMAKTTAELQRVVKLGWKLRDGFAVSIDHVGLFSECELSMSVIKAFTNV